ncbi:hypothetical protein [Flavobacterium sp. U410]
MKNILGVLLLAFFLHSCDDGDMTLQSFNFDSQSVLKCSDTNLLYKINDSEALLLSLPEGTLPTEETPDDEPLELSVNSSHKIIYRKYSDNVTSSSFCGEIPPATPVVTNEWNANGGFIIIITDYLYDSSNEIIGLTHNITFQNVSLEGGGETFNFETYIFGNYEEEF